MSNSLIVQYFNGKLNSSENNIYAKEHFYNDIKQFNERDIKELKEFFQSSEHNKAKEFLEYLEQYEASKKRIDKEVINNTIIDLLLKRDTNQATEELVKVINKENYIFCLRSDEKSEMYIYDKGIYIPEGKTFIKEFLREMLGVAYSSTLANKVLDKLEADNYISSEVFFEESNPYEIAVQNGILNIKTKELSEFTPEKRFFNKIPVEFNPDIDCPFIKKHFENVLKDKEDTPIIQELSGFLLLKEYKFEKAIMFTGFGRNGKGKTLELFKRFLGIDNCSNIPLIRFEQDNFALGELHKKLANLGGDLSNTSLRETGNFKGLTGRDLISAPRKFKVDVKFTNYAKMIFCANELPKTSDKTTAFFNRWILLDFPYTFLPKEEYEERKNEANVKLADSEIINKITTDEELSGFLNWALEGFERLMKNDGFSYSKTTEQVKTTWIRKSDSFSAFCMDCVKEDWDSKISKSELQRHYSIYCRKNKLKSASDKWIKHILMTDYGVGEGRLTNDDGTRELSWIGINVIPVIDVIGISGHIGNVKQPIGQKTYDMCDTYDTQKSLLEDNSNLEVIEEEVISDE